MRTAAIFLAAMVIGCGTADDGLTDGQRELQGTWMSSLNDACLLVATFDGTAEAFSLACQPPTGGSLLMQLDRGPFSADGRTVSMTIADSSCARGGDWTFGYSVNGSQLALTDASTITFLDRFTPTGPAMGSVSFGCFATDGTFSPMPIVPVP